MPFKKVKGDKEVPAAMEKAVAGKKGKPKAAKAAISSMTQLRAIAKKKIGKY